MVEKPFLGELHLPFGRAGQGVERGEAVLKVSGVEVSAVQVLIRPENIIRLSPDQCFKVELFCDLRGWTPCAEMARARKITQAAIFLLTCACANFFIVVNIILIINIINIKSIIRIEMSHSALSSASIWPCSPQQACLPRRLKQFKN